LFLEILAQKSTNFLEKQKSVTSKFITNLFKIKVYDKKSPILFAYPEDPGF